MSTLAVTPAYSALLARIPPQIIETEEQNEAYVEALYDLDEKGSAATAEERQLAALLTLLIEDFEEKSYALPRAPQHEVLRFLLEQRNESARSLGIHEVLDRSRELTSGEIRTLAAHFSVSPEVFF